MTGCSHRTKGPGRFAVAEKHTTLDVEDLHQAAEEATGLSDWGDDPSYRLGLEQLVDALAEHDAPAVGIESAGTEFVRLLSTRLRLREDERREPQILQTRVERPIVVIGLPRTGTTALFEILALDPEARVPEAWEARSPWPAPEREGYENDPRIAALQDSLDAMVQKEPETSGVHPWGARRAQECTVLTLFHFASVQFTSRLDVPRYAEWLRSGPVPGMYHTHKRVLQELQWKGPRGRWTLKSPAHLLDLPGLLEAYPDACLVQTHREPARSFASLASLVTMLARVGAGGYAPMELNPTKVGADTVRMWGTAIERAAVAREDSAVDRHVFDIPYHDIVVDPIAAVRRMYDHFDLPWTAAFEQQIGTWQARRTADVGKHRYTMDQFGIDAAALAEEFPTYRNRFSGLLTEPDRTTARP